MTANWEPGTQYNYGDVVQYSGHRYKIIQPHRSQGDWTPDVTPALWGRMQDSDSGYQGGNQQQPYNAPPQGYAPPQPLPSHEQKVDIPAEERKQNWYDLNDERKKQLEIGGGLLAGAAAIGAGIFAYKHHEKHEEEKKALAWSLQNWVHDARARSDDYRRNGPKGPATWILVQGKTLPPHVVTTGPEKDWNLYVCRSFIDGGIQVGKCSPAFKKGGVIGYKREEIHVDTYEVLVGDMNGLRWVPASGRLNVQALGHRPVEGGRESDGTPLYIARAPHEGAAHPGKASEKLDGAYIPYDGKEVCVKQYEVLCYA